MTNKGYMRSAKKTPQHAKLLKSWKNVQSFTIKSKWVTVGQWSASKISLRQLHTTALMMGMNKQGYSAQTTQQPYKWKNKFGFVASSETGTKQECVWCPRLTQICWKQTFWKYFWEMCSFAFWDRLSQMLQGDGQRLHEATVHCH